ncbi:PAS domain S-box protein [Flavobacterium sp. LB3P45]|uniref:histidine kinase n=1 Tax=Flavobacterium fructosi TaxID=3230416 RepID=A0ABW6HLD0_9FLAO
MILEKKWTKFISWFLNKPKTTGLLVFLFLSLVVGYIVYQQYRIVKEDEHTEMNNTLQSVQQNIEQSLRNCYTTALTLALTINDKGDPQNFDAIGKKLLESNHSISAVQLVPKGVIKYIYPMKGNEAVINLNILAPPYLKEALKSIATQKMYFAGPLDLKQGGVGIVGRFPVFHNNVFWGFSAVVIKLNHLLDSGINNADGSKYYFQLSKKNAVTLQEVFYLPNTSNFSKKYHISASIPDGEWKLYLISKHQNYLYYQILIPGILGLIFAAVFGFTITSLLRMPQEFQLLVHNQATKLLNSEIKYKSIFDQAAVGIAYIDSYSGNFLKINKQLCNLLGYSEQEMKEMSFQFVTYPDDLEEDLMSMAKLKEGKIRAYSMEKRYITKKNNVIWIKLTVSPLWNINEKPTTHIAIIEDISLKKEAEKELNDSFNLVTEQNKRLLNFSYIVSHNLRSHTSNISSIMDLIEISESEEERNEMIQLLKSISNSLNETMLHLNEVINIRTNIGLVSESLNLKQYIDTAQRVLTEQITLNDVAITSMIPDDVMVNYNPAYLESILYNVISNSIRYRHPERKPAISIKWLLENEINVLQISDNGVGIDLVKNADKIFGMYKTFSNNSDAKGIGLFITKNQIDAMGGNITVESEPNIGTTFKIYIQ